MVLHQHPPLLALSPLTCSLVVVGEFLQTFLKIMGLLGAEGGVGFIEKEEPTLLTGKTKSCPLSLLFPLLSSPIRRGQSREPSLGFSLQRIERAEPRKESFYCAALVILWLSKWSSGPFPDVEIDLL